MIIVGLGSEDDFLPISDVFIGNSKLSDYHHEMNWLHFEEWFRKVLNTVPDKSVLVIDRASYHMAITDETRNPTTKWRKAELIDWLRKHQIPFLSCLATSKK